MSPAQCTLVQASHTRKNAGSIVAGEGQAVWPVADCLYQNLRNLLEKFCIDISMTHKMFTHVLDKHIIII